MSSVLVTGASGFIGRFLVLALLQKQQYEQIFLLLRNPEQQIIELKAWLARYNFNVCENLTPIYGDLSKQDLAISQNDWTAMSSVEEIYHCGSIIAWGISMDVARQTNVDGSVRLMELAAQHLQLNRFIHTSGYMLSIRQHLKKLGIDETGHHPNWPVVYEQVGAYEASKIEAHFAVKQAAQQLSIPLTTIHPTAVIGHSKTGEIAASQEVARTITKLLNKNLPIVPEGYLPMVSVDDLTYFMAHIAEFPESIGQEYVLVNSEKPSIKAALTICARSAQIPKPYFAVPLGLLKQIARLGVLARAFELEKETLNFMQIENLDAPINTITMQYRMGLRESLLSETLKNTTEYVATLRS